MVIVMRSGADEALIHAVIDRLSTFGFDVHRSSGLHRTVLGAIGSKPGFDTRHIESLDGVEAVHRITVPYQRLVRAPGDPCPSWLLGDRTFGAGQSAVLAALSGADATPGGIRAAVAAGVDAVCVPYVGTDRLKSLVDVAGAVPVLVELSHGDEADILPGVVWGFRLTGTAMFERALRRRLADASAHVLVDRAPGSTVAEWLVAADDLVASGCAGVALCDAGSRGLEPGRPLSPDIAALAFVATRCAVPVVADPGRAVTDRDVAMAAALAAVGAGARGVVLSADSIGGEIDGAGLAIAAGRLRAVAAAVM